MAAWSDTTKHLPSSINSGNQYTVDDDVSLQELNNTVENAFYAVRVAENAEAATNNGVSYDAQSPTSGEKYQARVNIGALSSDPDDLSGEEMQDWKDAFGVSDKADKDAANLGGEDAAAWKTALGLGNKANVDASNLSSSNIDSFNTTLSNEKAYFDSNVINTFAATTQYADITGITARESQGITLSSNTLVVDKAGIYRIDISALVTADSSLRGLSILKNGTTITSRDVWSGFGNFDLHAFAVVKLSVGDIIKFQSAGGSNSYSIWRVKISMNEV